MKKSVLCLAIVLIAATVPASASDTGFYLGAGIGRSSVDILEFYPSSEILSNRPTPHTRSMADTAF